MLIIPETGAISETEWRDWLATRRTAGRSEVPARRNPCGRLKRSPRISQVPNARHGRAATASRAGSRAGAAWGRVSGPRRSSTPQITAPAAKMPAHHQNTVV